MIRTIHATAPSGYESAVWTRETHEAGNRVNGAYYAAAVLLWLLALPPAWGAEQTPVPDSGGILGAVMGWTFHPFVVVHLGAFLVTQFLKFPLCQWAPVQIYNAFAKVDVTGICPRTRKTLTMTLGFLVAFLATLLFWPHDFYRGAYGVLQIAIINGVFNPLLVALFFAAANRVPWLQPIAGFLGAREVDPDAHPLVQPLVGKRTDDGS